MNIKACHSKSQLYGGFHKVGKMTPKPKVDERATRKFWKDFASPLELGPRHLHKLHVNNPPT